MFYYSFYTHKKHEKNSIMSATLQALLCRFVLGPSLLSPSAAAAGAAGEELVFLAALFLRSRSFALLLALDGGGGSNSFSCSCLMVFSRPRTAKKIGIDFNLGKLWVELVTILKSLIHFNLIYSSYATYAWLVKEGWIEQQKIGTKIIIIL